jgi:hypothetical protein
MPKTIGEAYGPAMQITDQDVADDYFKSLVRECLEQDPSLSVEKAESIQRQNLGYYAGYYDDETRERVERLFRCSHPVFGSYKENGSPSPEEAFAMGVTMATDSE